MISSIIQINTDGGSRGNPGPAAIGAIAVCDGQTIFTISEKIGHNTNNVAEYLAVKRSLDFLSDLNIANSHISFVLDSELVVKQITGIYKVKQEHLQNILADIKVLVTTLKQNNNLTFGFKHVRREFNKDADRLVNLALDN